MTVMSAAVRAGAMSRNVPVIVRYIAAALSGLALAIPYLEPALYIFSWVAFVPLLFAVNRQPIGRCYRLSLTCGLVFYCSAASWIVNFFQSYNGLGAQASYLTALLFWLYCSHLLVFLVVAFRLLVRISGVSALWVFPFLVSVCFRYYPMLFPVQLGESQSQFILGLQPIEFFGVSSLDYMIGLVNVLIFMKLRDVFAGGFGVARRRSAFGSFMRGHGLSSLCALGLVVGWFCYGGYALLTWDERILGWEARKIGLVQPNEAPSAKVPLPAGGYSRSYPPELALSEQLGEFDAEFIVWPETRYKGYFKHAVVRSSFARTIKQLNTPIVFQDTEYVAEAGSQRMYNSAVYLNADGLLSSTYRKIKRVPLGEYVPLIGWSEPFKQWFYRQTGGFFVDFSAGSEPGLFLVGDIGVVPLICYEIMVPELSASAVGAGAKGKVLLALSNNSWFGDSAQPYQHFNASRLRSVESRVPLIHVTNNGPSGVVLPNGRLAFESDHGVIQAAVVAMPFSSDSGGSFFSAYPFIWSWLMLAIFLLLCFCSVFSVQKK